MDQKQKAHWKKLALRQDAHSIKYVLYSESLLRVKKKKGPLDKHIF